MFVQPRIEEFKSSRCYRASFTRVGCKSDVGSKPDSISDLFGMTISSGWLDDHPRVRR